MATTPKVSEVHVEKSYTQPTPYNKKRALLGNKVSSYCEVEATLNRKDLPASLRQRLDRAAAAGLKYAMLDGNSTLANYQRGGGEDKPVNEVLTCQQVSPAEAIEWYRASNGEVNDRDLLHKLRALHDGRCIVAAGGTAEEVWEGIHGDLGWHAKNLSPVSQFVSPLANAKEVEAAIADEGKRQVLAAQTLAFKWTDIRSLLGGKDSETESKTDRARRYGVLLAGKCKVKPASKDNPTGPVKLGVNGDLPAQAVLVAEAFGYDSQLVYAGFCAGLADRINKRQVVGSVSEADLQAVVRKAFGLPLRAKSTRAKSKPRAKSTRAKSKPRASKSTRASK